VRRNPHSPDALDILERPFPLDQGFWSFDVSNQAGDDQDFGYLAPPGVEIKPLPGETVVEIPSRPPREDEDNVVQADFSGALAVFTTKPIPADKIIEFGLYPDFHALPHFLLEILHGADHVELENNHKYLKGNVALIHRDTYPTHERTTRKGVLHDYRITYFDQHGPSGHHNGTFFELLQEALRGGYRILSPGAVDRITGG
jgi:hypothetical protein